MKNICVFCSAGDVEERYVQETVKFGELMVAHGYDLVWGGSNVGLMKVIADTVQNAGGKLIGISVEFLRDKVRDKVDEMIISPNIGERKRLLLDRGDAIVLLVGGLGSLSEIAEVVDLKKLNQHKKPIVILNSYGFYAGLKAQLERMYKEHFLHKSLSELLYFAESPQDVISYLDKHVF